LVVIRGQKNYKLNTKHAIGGVVAEGTREGEVGGGSIPNNHVAREKCHDLHFDGDRRVGYVLSNNCFCLFLKPMFLKIIFTSGFITSTVSGNRFLLVVFLTGGP
jgi:hypothetical protein